MYTQLIEWNYEYGSNLQSSIDESWNAAQSAAERYGDFVTALMDGIEDDIDSINTQITSLETQISNLSTSTSGSNGISTTTSNGSSASLAVSTTESTTSNNSNSSSNAAKSNLENVNSIVLQMMELSDKWHFADADTRKELSEQALQLSKKLSNYGVTAERNTAGEWYITKDKLNPENVNQLLYLCYPKYHTGGIVGDSTMKQDEVMAVLQKGEAVLDEERQNALYRIIDFTTTLSEKLSKIISDVPMLNSLAGSKNSFSGLENLISGNNGNSQPNIQITENITCVPSESVEAHQKISRDTLNEIARQIRKP